MPKRSFPRCIASCCRGCRRAHIHRAAASTQTVRSFTLKLARWGPWSRTRGENRTARQTTSCGVCLSPQTSPSRHLLARAHTIELGGALPGSVAPGGSLLLHSITKLCLNCLSRSRLLSRFRNVPKTGRGRSRLFRPVCSWCPHSPQIELCAVERCCAVGVPLENVTIPPDTHVAFGIDCAQITKKKSKRYYNQMYDGGGAIASHSWKMTRHT